MPSFFQIAARPSAAEFEEALTVVRSYLAARPEVVRRVATTATVQPGETPAPARGPGDAASPEPAEVALPGPVALHAVQTEAGVSSGVVGETTSIVGGRGVWGIGSGSAGANYGVYGQSAAPLGVGVYGTGTTGVHGETGTAGGSGVYGETGTAGAYGVHGKHTDGGLAGLFDGSLKAQRATGLTGGPVVEGVVLSGLGQGVKGAGALGAWGYLGGASTGGYGETGLADGYGVYGKHTGGYYAGYFEGDLGVTGDVDISNLSCDGCVTTPAIAEGAVTEAQIADNSVRTQEIVDGTILPADIAPFTIYRNKGSLYRVLNTNDIPSGGHVHTVACRDANDLPLQGTCYAPGFDVTLRGAQALHWNSSTEPAQYDCMYDNLGEAAGSVVSGILCVQVE